MGNQSSSAKGALEAFYGGYAGAAGITGGDELPTSYLGGAPDYASSLMSSAKKQLIKDLATVLGDKLGIQNLKGVAKKDTAEIVDALRKYIPDPRAGFRFSANKDLQIKACNVLAKAINDRMGNMINMDAPAEEQCRNVAEIMFALFTGLTGELAAARKDVERVMKNLATVEEVLQRQYQLIENEIKSDKDSNLAAKTSAIRAIHDDIMKEHNRQMGLLQGMLDTIIKPSEMDLAELTKDAKELKRAVKRIRRMPGTVEYGRKIAYALGELGLVSQAASIVDKALKELGISHKEYAKAGKGKELKKLLSEGAIKELGLNEAALDRYEQAKDALYRYQYMHDDLVKKLSKSGGKHSSKKGGDIGIELPPVTGGLKLDKRVQNRKSLKQALIRDFEARMSSLVHEILVSAKHIAKAFSSGKVELGDKLRSFIKALELIPDLNQKYTYFALTGAIDDITARQEREKFQSNSRHVISTIDALLPGAGSAAPYLKDMRASFSRINELVDAYVKKFSEGFGPIESWKSYTKERGELVDPIYGRGVGSVAAKGVKYTKKAVSAIPGALRKVSKTMEQSKGSIKEISKTVSEIQSDSDSEKSEESKPIEGAADIGIDLAVGGADIGIDLAVGGADIGIDLTEGGADIGIDLTTGAGMGIDLDDIVEGGSGPGMTRTANDLKEAISTITYFHRVSMMRRSMANAAKEHDAYKSDYVKLLADAIADGRDQVARDRKTWEKTHRKNDDLLEKAAPSPGEESYYYVQFMNSAVPTGTSPVSYWKKEHKVRAKLNTKYDELLKFGLDTFSARDNMFKVAENMDIYMSEFTDGITKNPDDIQNIMSMLNNTETIAQWFNSTSGDLVARVFDAFPSSTGPTYSNLNGFNGEGHYYLRVAAIGNMTTALDASVKKEHPELKDYADWNAWADKNVDNKRVDNRDTLPGNPFQALKIYSSKDSEEWNRKHSAVSALADARKVSNFGALKNLIAAFATIGARFGGNDLLKRTNMSSKLFLKYMSEYIACSSFAMNDDTVKMRRAGDDNDFGKTDELFQLVVKAIVAKILTVIGTYNMINRPINRAGLGYKSGLRFILGGSEQPKVVPEALELYIRLPLLAEFYRRIFKFEEADENISMIPEMDGTFSGLISIIFDKAKTVDDGNYSDSEIRMLVEQMNKIFARFSGSKNPVQDTITEFIAEVNRRYGVVKAGERQSYLDEKKSRYETKYEDPLEITDYEVAGIDEDDDYRRPTPSDAYLGEGADLSGAARGHKYKLNSNDKKLIDGLRNEIDNIFTDAEKNMSLGDDEDIQGKLKNVSFTNMINSRKEELKHAQSERERYEIVRSAISSLGTFATTTLERSYIMFHETVISGLNVLYGTYRLLKNFKKKVEDMSSVVTNLNDLLGYNAERDIYSDKYDTGVTDDFGVPGEYASQFIDAGTQGADVSVTKPQLLDWYQQYNNAADKDKKDLVKQFVHRFAIDQNKLFKHLFEALFDHSSTLDGLVDLKIDNVTIDTVQTATTITYKDRKLAVHIDHSKLREKIYSLFNSVKQNFEKFRGLLPANVINRYESFNRSKNDKNTGSIYWIEKKLIDQLLDGKYTDDKQHGKGLDALNRNISAMTNYFTKKWNVTGHSFRQFYAAPGGLNFGDYDNLQEYYGNTALTVDPVNKFVYHNFFDAVSELTHINTSTNKNIASIAFPSLRAPVDPANQKYTDDHKLLKLLSNMSGKRKGAVEPGDVVDTTLKNLFNPRIVSHNPGSWYNAADDEKGLVISFNRLLDAYIGIVYDEPSRSVYLPTVNKFANGAFSVAVSGDNVWKASADRSLDFNASTGNQRSILMQSTAVMLRQLVSEKNLTGTDLEYAKADLSTVPMYLVERMKSNLPVFKKLFTFLMKRTELAKKFAQVFNITKQSKTLDAEDKDNVSSDKDITSKVVNALDQVSRGCYSLIQCINDTINDLADSPKFFETYGSFISDYENMNGTKPFMPISSSLYYLGDKCDNINYDAMPLYNLGSTQFKMLYGTRGLFAKESISLSDVPGVGDIVSAHNSTTDPKHHFDNKRVESYVADLVQLLQYGVNSRRYKNVLEYNTNYAVGNIFDGSDNRLLTYQLGVNLGDIVRLTESNSQREQRNKVLNQVENALSEEVIIHGKRSDLIAYNIIDMNIVPINIHALMREIPLVNLYNYSYTFDHLVGQIIPRNSAGPRNAEELFAKLLCEPYADVTDSQYDFFVKRIMRGALGIQGLGRPKYLGDEIYNKVLFGEIVTDNSYDDEMGPSGSHPFELGTRQDVHKQAEIITDKARLLVTDIDDVISQLVPLYESTDSIDWNAIYTAVDNNVTSGSGYKKPENKVLLKALFNEMKKNTENRRSSFVPASRGGSKLHWLEPDSKGKSNIVGIDVGTQKPALRKLGKDRFDTSIIRNLTWITNIQRILRLKLRRDLMWYNEKVVSDHATIAPGLTELYDHDLHPRGGPNMYNYKY